MSLISQLLNNNLRVEFHFRYLWNLISFTFPPPAESRDVVDLSVDTLPRPLSATLDTRSVQTPAAQTSPLLPPIAPANHVVVGSLPRSTSAQKSILPAHIVSEETNNRFVLATIDNLNLGTLFVKFRVGSIVSDI